MIQVAENIGADSSNIADSIAVDSIDYLAKHTGYVLERPRGIEVEKREKYFGTESWVIAGLLILLVAVCLRVQANRKYLVALLTDITDVRERHNVFDDTVRESFLLVMLNVLWSCCAGILLYGGISEYSGIHLPGGGESILQGVAGGGLYMAVCGGVALVYTAIMTFAYWIVGNVFSDRAHTAVWIKGFLAEQGLSVILLLPLSLLMLSYPEWTPTIEIIAIIVFIIGKIVFIWKGFRIFFIQMRSWLIFLYYLCSLEIVPLVLTIILAMELCSIL